VHEERVSKARMLGQYFTPGFVAEFMVSLVTKPRDALVLEPCAGTGVFLSALHRAGFRRVDAYEIDPSLPNRSPVEIAYRDFLKVRPEERYEVVIGNPPYVRWRNIPRAWREEFRRSPYWGRVMNGLSDLAYAFIYHSVNMLREGGELIFITPVSWMGTVHGARLREYLIRRGYLDLVVNFNEMRVFEGVSTATMIFKYVKSRARGEVKVKVVDLHAKEALVPSHLRIVGGLLSRLDKGEPYIREGVYEAFLHSQPRGGEPWRFMPPLSRNPLLSPCLSPVLYFARVTPLGSVAEIGSGMVSGLDEAFRLRAGTGGLTVDEREHVIYVYKAHTLGRFVPAGRPVPYIYVDGVRSEEELRARYPNFYEHLAAYKGALLRRYSYGRAIPWWHWAFPRNKHVFERYEEKILVPSKERLDTRGYFRFAYVRGRYYATHDVTVICPRPAFREGALYLLALLNSSPYQEYIRHRGFARGSVYDFSEGHLATTPVLRINWNNAEERKAHEEITRITGEIVARGARETTLVEELDAQVSRLLNIALR
jgi:adenine-specific DNA-methyltransferase